MTRALVLHWQDSFVLDELYLPQLSKHPRYAVLRCLVVACPPCETTEFLSILHIGCRISVYRHSAGMPIFLCIRLKKTLSWMYELRFLLILCVCHFSLRIIGASVHFLHGNFVLFQHFPAGEPIERNFLNNFSKIFSDFVWTATGDSFTQKIKLASGEE